MRPAPEDAPSFSRWIARPQSLIALAAVLLSLCGVFVAVYEAHLVRRQQRASVWPYVEISASLTGDLVEVRVRNSGVGPALVRAAAVRQGGETLRDWGDLTRRSGVDPAQVRSYFSLLHGRVLPRDSEPETVFRVTAEESVSDAALVAWLAREIRAGAVDVMLCYCSVFEECWTSSLQDVVRPSAGVKPEIGDRAVEGCEEAPRSGI